MRYAETGFNLEIDLSRGNIERVATDPRDTELYLGGLGTNAKILWDRVPPDIDAFSPENLLIFGTGLLCGTTATGCNRTIVTTISPQTKLMAYFTTKAQRTVFRRSLCLCAFVPLWLKIFWHKTGQYFLT